MRIVPGSGGSFLCPPGHPAHFQHIEHGPYQDPDLIAGLDYALQNEYGDVPDALRAKVQALFDDATFIESEAWVQIVYGYFHNCYAPENGSRNVSDAIIPRGHQTLPPPERHLGFLMVRKYFPDHELRKDLIAGGGSYGTRPCRKCGTTLQYEASVDRFAVAVSREIDCPSGGEHDASVPDGPVTT